MFQRDAIAKITARRIDHALLIALRKSYGPHALIGHTLAYEGPAETGDRIGWDIVRRSINETPDIRSIARKIGRDLVIAGTARFLKCPDRTQTTHERIHQLPVGGSNFCSDIFV